MTLRVRRAAPADAARDAAIYHHYVTATVVTFDLDPPVPDGDVAGYGYVTAWKPRPAYRFTGEDSIYLDPAARGGGLGRALLDALVDGARVAGLRRLVASIADTGHPAPVRLHRAAGFRSACRLERVGWRFDSWIDVEFMQLDLDGS